MTVDAWLRAAVADASGRGLSDIEPLLKTLGQATRALRAADFNDHASGATSVPRPADASSKEP
jgi:hypothetical protein